jgi:hypothetical protein
MDARFMYRYSVEREKGGGYLVQPEDTFSEFLEILFSTPAGILPPF